MHQFLQNCKLFEHEFVFVGFGNQSMLLEEGKRKKIELNSYLKRWVDLSRVFPTKLFPTSVEQKAYDFDRRDPKERQPVVHDLSQMVKLAGIQW